MAVLTAALPRSIYLKMFHTVLQALRDRVPARKELLLVHVYLATMTDDEFDTIFAEVLAHPDAKHALSSLRLIDSLPDRHHWDRVVDQPDDNSHWSVLAQAVARTFDHQSEASTDIRWLKVMTVIVCQERMRFPEKLAEEVIAPILAYPSKGDMKRVRPSIRSLELMCRSFESSDVESPEVKQRVLPSYHGDAFWQEMWVKQKCLVLANTEHPDAIADGVRELQAVRTAVEEHFYQSATTTAADPRHEGAFGLVLYGMEFVINAAVGAGHAFSEGRLALRTVMEAFVTLHYLLTKDDPTIWAQYRNYGSGQAKLAFLKNLRFEDAPDFVDLEMLEKLANEDVWMEFQSVELGHWANLNLRKMADEAGVKDVYDRYYDWTSGFAHGQWASVRDTVMVTCLNPLHRFHRVPSPTPMPMPSILPDAQKLLNRMLDDLNQLYPSFKPRLKGLRKDG
ncbi:MULTISPECIES: DUF5677 domain-containing protein [Devosia]|uniref:DUF5677 domain-containing protein n=1 Tax=Devosia TaxID=46913 RepID=UPI000CE96AC5|nr:MULTISPECIES: DUF5677 domain-containing protein [Devosia]AVF03757.1 hypothetical protein C4375_08485 [Devosia sp. I507]